MSSELTPKQVRAARALLAWSQQDLAKAAGVGTSTIADFERGSRTPIASNANAIRTALEGAGITFPAGGAVIGPAFPPLTGAIAPGIPVRWVSAQDLADWGDRIDGSVNLPTLISMLVRASLDPSLTLRFPSEEAVRHAGWDGVTTAMTGNTYLPKGRAGWELSVQRSGTPAKAQEDYNKRTDDPGTLVPATDTFVFVTLRHWPDKDLWARERQAKGPWREVRVYDANDLVHWIEQHPAVGLWIASRLNKRLPGIRELEQVWEEWSRATEWPLTEDLVLADRSEDSAELLRWLRSAPSMLCLQATTTEEVAAFVHATLAELPSEAASSYRTRCLVVTTLDGARALINAPPPLILILTEPDAGVARSLVQRGHYVLLASDERLIGKDDIRSLARPSREGIAAALQAGGMAEPRARALARESGRNLAALRRLIRAAPGHLPLWAEGTPPKALLAAMLAGGWDETSDGDRTRLSELADQPYDAVIADLAPLLTVNDSPIQKAGHAWRITSPSDAWFLLAHFLTPGLLGRFTGVAEAVLGAPDPRFDMDPDDRWAAAVQGITPANSALLRHGLGQTLILLALHGDKAKAISDASLRAEGIVRQLLRNADAQRWWSLSGDFRLLAEASPYAFLDAVEESLDQDNPSISALFGHDGDAFFGTEHLADLMWALEVLAWSPDWIVRVTLVLARLDAIDVKPRKYTNGPMDSLRKIHILWLPQTFASQEQRLRALDLIRQREPETAWKLMLKVLPGGHDSSSYSAMPRWRDFSIDKPEIVTWGMVHRGAAKIAERLLDDVGKDARRWAALLERLNDLGPSLQPTLDALDAAEPQILDKSDRIFLWNELRRLLHRHREFSDAEWSLEDALLDRLEAIYDRLAPVDLLERSAWLFEDGAAIPNPAKEGWQAGQRQLTSAREVAARTIFAERGPGAILALARLVDPAGYIGKAIYEAGVAVSDLDPLLELAVRSDDPRERNLAHGLIVSMFRDRKETWAADLLVRAHRDLWGETALLTILRALPASRWTWDQVAKLGGDIQTSYWKHAPLFWLDEDNAALSYAIRHLVDVGRARHALALIGNRNKGVPVPTPLLLDVLDKAANQAFQTSDDGNEATMFQHYVAETLSELDTRADVDRHALARLEWNYLRLLEHSRRPPKVLLSVLAEEPRLFVEMLTAMYKASEAASVVEPEPEDPEQARAVANQAYRLLDLWDHIPGRRDDNTIDGVFLQSWIKDARSLAKASGRADIADHKIGNMLSASPIGADGNWPAEPVREVLDLFRSKAMLDGFWIGKANRRGFTRRMPGDGGEQERDLTARFRAWAKAIEEHPYTAKALNELADMYEREARRQDESAERRDWLD